MAVLYKEFLSEGELCVRYTFCASAQSLQLPLIPRDLCEGPRGRSRDLERDAVPQSVLRLRQGRGGVGSASRGEVLGGLLVLPQV